MEENEDYINPYTGPLDTKFFQDLMREQPMYTVPSNKWAVEIASKIPCSCLDELFDNAEKIKNYCKQPL